MAGKLEVKCRNQAMTQLCTFCSPKLGSKRDHDFSSIRELISQFDKRSLVRQRRGCSAQCFRRACVHRKCRPSQCSRWMCFCLLVCEAQCSLNSRVLLRLRADLCPSDESFTPHTHCLSGV